MTPEVLLLAGLFDFSADLVALRLRDFGVRYLRLNREQLPDTKVTVDPFAQTVRVTIDDHTWELGSDVRAVWFRQPVFLRNLPAEPMAVTTQLERSQWMALVKGLALFAHTNWVNHPRETFHAESKLVQLSVARQLGFNVPRTIVSNDKDEIRRAFPTSFALKPLDTVLLRDGPDDLFAYTSVARAEDFDDTAVSSAPIIAQELLSNKEDIRVTVIGNYISAVRILANGRGIEGDWRRLSKDHLRYEEIELPANVERLCRSLVRNLGLVYGAIDLAVRTGTFYFLEINPTGEFGWLCSDRRPYDKIIAALLAGFDNGTSVGL